LAAPDQTKEALGNQETLASVPQVPRPELLQDQAVTLQQEPESASTGLQQIEGINFQSKPDLQEAPAPSQLEQAEQSHLTYADPMAMS